MNGGVGKNVKIAQIGFCCLPWAQAGPDGNHNGIYLLT